ncbi:hypothetical protein QPK87_00810 [Kamptonema cortianum]|nr:hypothetical protein [Kamptonema cortianum]
MAIDSQLLQQASNPNTPPEQLRELATCEDVAIRQLVVANPNTPTEVLWRLGKLFPAQLLENPLLPLLFLENPNLIVQIPDETLVRLFELETVPDCLYQRLTQAKLNVRRAIAKNLNTPVPWLEHLAQDPEEWVRGAIALNPKTPIPWLEHLAQDPDAGVEGDRL